MSMKLFCLLIVFFLCSSCNNSQVRRKDAIAEEIRVLNDSALNLMFKFTKNSNDTTIIEKALSVSDRMLAVDTSKEHEFENLYLRAQVLYCLGRYKENFELMGRIQNKYGSDIDRMIHKGMEYKIKGKDDSTQYYLNIALDQCDNMIADSLYIVCRIAEIYMIMDKKSELKKYIEELSIRYPDKVDDLNHIFEETDKIKENLSFLFEAYKNAEK